LKYNRKKLNEKRRAIMPPPDSSNQRREQVKVFYITETKNDTELRYHWDMFKTNVCRQSLRDNMTVIKIRDDSCPDGFYCSDAHSNRELKGNAAIFSMKKTTEFFLFYFKTELCPFSNAPHDKDLCPYAHSTLEVRRDPSIFTYKPIMCPNWYGNKPDESLCPTKSDCKYSHGELEVNYHPLNYLRTECSQGKKCKD